MPPSDPVVERPITALERACLEYLAERWRSACEASRIAEWMDKSLPRVQAALGRLRERGAVAYFEGHPGSWAVTALGRSLIDLDTAHDQTERYRMGLETIVQLWGDSPTDSSWRAAQVAKLALGSRRA